MLCFFALHTWLEKLFCVYLVKKTRIPFCCTAIFLENQQKFTKKLNYPLQLPFCPALTFESLSCKLFAMKKCKNLDFEVHLPTTVILQTFL